MTRDRMVSLNPEIKNGTLVFAGTRVPAEILIQHLVAGASVDVYLSDFPSVSREQVVAFLQNALRDVGTSHAASTLA